MHKVTVLAVGVVLAAWGRAAAQTPTVNTSAAMPAMAMPMPQPAGQAGTMAGTDMAQMEAALGPYAMGRESSGTSWQPDTSPFEGIHGMDDGWALMLHSLLNGVYDAQGGPRGAYKAFAAGMVMGMASHDLGERGRLQLRAMVSPDPFMGPNGYPLLLATGETADGRTPLIDRQHPHDLFMELSASTSYRLTDRTSAFLYFGLPGEPAFGPPAFMHRLSIMDSPEAPISHHWVDSMHITEGVLTGGLTHGGFKIEASGFRGREPDQHRYDIETPGIDSVAVRASLNPTPRLALQVSWARQISPEQLDPLINERRWSASGIYTVPIGREGFWSTTAIWARRQAFGQAMHNGQGLDAWVLESAVHPNPRWTVFSRAERIDNDELFDRPLAQSGPAFPVGKVELGAIRDFQVLRHVKFGIGAQLARNFVGHALSGSYDGDQWGGMAFVRFKLD